MITNTHFNAAYPFNPSLLPPNINFGDERLLNLVIKARAELGELKGYSFSMPNPLLLLSPAIIKESLASSKIENINTTMIDVLENQLFPEIEQKEPDKEVLRYRDAIMWGYKNLKEYSLSTRMITGIQGKLMPTEYIGYRQAQNGIENSAKREIIYTPPVAASIPNLMNNLEKFMNISPSKQMDPLIRCIISHYQFEAIHPFSDGNGRTGRILMVLELINSGIINYPILYISGYINKHRNEYYKLLLEVTVKQNWYEYIAFMLEGFYTQAMKQNSSFLESCLFFLEYKKTIKRDFKNIYSADLVEILFSYPIITPMKLSTELGVYRNTASSYLKQLATNGILTEKRYGKYHFYANKKLLEVLHGIK